jgi:hypothetical protein
MDSRNCQTSTATPAKPGVFPILDKQIHMAETFSASQAVIGTVSYLFTLILLVKI